MGILVTIVILFMLLIVGLTLGMALLPFIIGILILGLIAFVFVFWIWMLIDCVKNQNIGGTEKACWVVVIALTHFIGALVYLFAGKLLRSGPAVTARPMA
jgi:hypothetical protein